MDNETTPTTTETPAEESRNFKQLRERMEQLESENTTLKSAVRYQAFKEAGIDVSEGTPGQLLYNSYTGDSNVKEITDFAKQYGIDPATSAPATTEPVVSPAQQQADLLVQSSTPANPQSLLEQAAAAEADGDLVKAASIKDAILRQGMEKIQAAQASQFQL